MGKTYTNPGTFAGSWEIRVQRPLDDRVVVESYDDLINPNTWLSKDGNYYHYRGMTVSVMDTQTIYIYIGKSGDITDVKDENKWISTSQGDVSWNEG